MSRPTSYEKLIFTTAVAACLISAGAWWNTRALRRNLESYTVPDAVERDVRSILASVESDAPAAPLDAAKVKDLSERLAAQVNALKLPQRQLLATELERASWGLEVRDLINERRNVTASGILARRLVANRLHANVPTGAPHQLGQQIEQLQDGLRQQAEVFIRAAMATDYERLKRTWKALLASPANVAGASEEPASSLSDATLILEGWNDDPKFANLRKAFDQCMKNQETVDTVVSRLRAQCAEPKRGATKERLEQIGRQGQELDGLLALVGDDFPQLKAEVRNRAQRLLDEQTKILQNARNSYQTWALDQIAAFHKAWDGGKKSAESVITFLLPIDESFLERPVAQAYQESFQGGWRELEKTRLQIAKASVTVAKVKPEDLIAKGDKRE